MDGRVCGALLTAFFFGSAIARDGDLIDAFGSGGVTKLGLVDAYGSMTSSPVVDGHGAIVFCGTRTNGTDRDFFVARVKADGTPDTSFSGDGKITVDFDGNDDECMAVAVQADGRIIAAGFTGDGDFQTFALVRFLESGLIDPTFGVNGRQRVQFDIYASTYSEAYALAVQPDGRILVGGELFLSGPKKNFAVARLLPDGSYDTSFNDTGRQRVQIVLADDFEYSAARSMTIDSAGRILLGGLAEKRIGDTRDSDFAAARLLADGTLDTSFGNGGYTTVAFDFGGATGTNDESAFALRMQADGRIVLAGDADVSATDTPNADIAVTRLLPNGALDTSFGIDGHSVVAFDRTPSGADVSRALVLDGANILVGGFAQASNNNGVDIALLRLLPNGSRDPSFGTLGRRTIDFHLTNPGVQGITGLALEGSRLLFAGLLRTSTTTTDAMVGAVESDTIFAYEME
jgi:uncharacterized delta-60 repeat protein